MTALALIPSNVLVAAFPQHRRVQIGIEAQERRVRWAARKAEVEASRPAGFQPRVTVVPPSRAGQILGEKSVHRFTGRSGERHTFVAVSGADRETLAAGPVILLASRRVPGRVDTLGVEAFEAENATRLNAWLDRAAAAKGIDLYACCAAGSRLARAAVVADLSDKPARRSAFVVDGRYDRRAIMAAAVAAARLSCKATGATWGACLSAALVDAWQAAKAARLAAAL